MAKLLLIIIISVFSATMLLASFVASGQPALPNTKVLSKDANENINEQTNIPERKDSKPIHTVKPISPSANIQPEARSINQSAEPLQNQEQITNAGKENSVSDNFAQKENLEVVTTQNFDSVEFNKSNLNQGQDDRNEIDEDYESEDKDLKQPREEEGNNGNHKKQKHKESKKHGAKKPRIGEIIKNVGDEVKTIPPKLDLL